MAGSRAPVPSKASRSLEEREVARARTVARWLDDRLLDPILGFLVPGVGDLLTTGAGLYVLRVAFRQRLPAVVLARMLINLAIDTAVGAIPIVGDLFDLFFKAHRRNLRLLEERHLEQRSTAGDWLYVGGAGLLLLGAIALPFVIVWLIATQLF